MMKILNNEYNHIAKSLAATTLWDSENGEGKIGFEQHKNNRSGFTAYPSGSWDGESFLQHWQKGLLVVDNH